MATDVRIEINGQEVDTDAARIPLALSRLIDKWEDLIGTEGTKAKALSDTLYLPATPRNNLLFSSFGDIDKVSTQTQGLLTIELFANGISTFVGSCQRVSIAKTWTINTVIAVKVLGDAVDVWQRIDGLTLRDLPMGDFIATPANVNATWSALADDSRPLVFAPMFYGGATASIVTVVANSYSYSQGLRPSVRVRAILKAMFEGQLGYTLESSFFDSQAGRNMVYPYGVGDDWERTDDITPFQCLVGVRNPAAPPQVWIGAQAAVRFSLVTPLGGINYGDPQGLNNIVGRYFEPPANGWYAFEFRIDGVNIEKIILEGEYYLGFPTTVNLGEYEPNVTHIVEEPILFEPNQPQIGGALTRLRFVAVRAQDPPNTITINSGYYRATLTNRFAYGGQPLRIASCLHDAAQKDFLRGLQHLGFVIGVDNVARRVIVEPRFNNVFQAAAIPTPPQNVNDAYYQSDDSAVPVITDVTETQLQHKRPFGDSLTLAYGIDSSDALYQYIAEKRSYGDANALPLLGSRINMVAADNRPTVSRNPFFTYLLNVGFNVTPVRRQQFPCMVEDIGELTANLDGSIRKATWRAAPKLAMYYGVLDFQGAGFFQEYQLAYTDSPTGANIIIYAFPCVFQFFPEDVGYFETLGGVPFSVCYAGIDYMGIPTNPYILGMIDRFHSKYLAIIWQDKWLSTTLRVKLSEYRADLFRMPKLLELGGKSLRVWQTETTSFEPQTAEIAQVGYILDHANIKDFTYSEERNSDRPVVITGLPFELIVSPTPALDVDAVALLDAIFDVGGTVTGPQEVVVSNFFTGLKDDGIYDLYDAIYLIIGGIAAAHKFNAKNPLDTDAAFRLLFYGGWMHSTTGALPNGVNAYADTFFTPSIHGIADNMGISYWSRTSSTGAYAEMGCNGFGGSAGIGQTYIFPNVSGTNFRAINYDGNQANTGINTKGLFSTNRTNSTSFDFSANGTVTNTTMHAAILNERSSRKIYIGARNNNGTADLFSNRECIFAAIHKGMTPAQQLAQYNRGLALQIGFGNRHL